MLETNIKADETTLSTLIPGMVAAQQWDRVLELAKHGLKSTPAIPIAAETMNSALVQMRAAPGQGLQAMKLQTMMQEANIRVAPRSTRRP